ncbi:MAG TPA: hypothetical protein VLE23_18945 [Geminicoccaceae bacterium]|nr:hypothetical protein [Geminicoccaceae bacterium]
MAETTTKTESRLERDLKSDVDAIKSDLDTLRKDLTTVLDRIKGTATSRAESEIQALQKRLNKIADDLQTGGRESLRAVEERIEERPLVSLGIAFAVGLVLGRLFDRR